MTKEKDNELLNDIARMYGQILGFSHEEILQALSRRVLAIQEKVDTHTDILLRHAIIDMCIGYHGKTDEEIRAELKSRGDTDEEIDDMLQRMHETKKRAGVK